jgi:hypothetical protein
MGCNVVLFGEWFPTVRRVVDDDTMNLYEIYGTTHPGVQCDVP